MVQFPTYYYRTISWTQFLTIFMPRDSWLRVTYGKDKEGLITLKLKIPEVNFTVIKIKHTRNASGLTFIGS